MIKKPLGNSNIFVSQIGLGLSQFSEINNKERTGYVSEKEVNNTLRYAISNNINFFDTADNYGDTEKILGKLPKYLKDKTVISTKVCPTKDGSRIFNKIYLEKKLDKSLKNLNSEKIDIFMFNKPNFTDFLSEDLSDFIFKLKKKGKIISAGIIVRDCFKAKKFLEFDQIDCFSILYNLNELTCGDFISKAYKKNKGIVVRSPLNSGLLSGKFDVNTKFQKNDYRKKYFSKNLFIKKMEKIDEIKQNLKITSNQLKKFSLDFILTNKKISSTLIGCSSFNQLKDIISYHKNTKYLDKTIYNKSYKIIKNISEKYNISNQI